MPIVDADTHVDETEDTWEHLARGVQHLKPYSAAPKNLDPNRPPTRYWMVDGRRVLRFIRSDERTGTTAATRELLNVDARLRAMDAMGVDIQVIYPTIFLVEFAVRNEVEEALKVSYNHWMAERCRASGGRLRWVMLPPAGNMDRCLDEVRFAKENGAVGVMKKGNQEAGDHWLDDPYFFPLYEEAQKLNLPLCFHTGTGVPDFTSTRNFSSGAFYRISLPVVHAFHSIIRHGLTRQFPELRFGFIEATASWVPYVLFELRRQLAKLHLVDDQLRGAGFEVGANPLRTHRIYVSFMAGEDLPYLMQFTGEDNLVTGSDYSHSDHSAELGFVDLLQQEVAAGRISAVACRKIVDDNPRAFYGL